MSDLEGQDLVIQTVREYVDIWRGFPLARAQEAYPQDRAPQYVPKTEGERALTETSMALLQHWFRADPHELIGPNGSFTTFKYWPHQRRAVETFIYLYEVRGIRRTEELYALCGVEALAPQFDPWAKLGAQLATGAGKTKVMSLLVAYSTLNAALDPKNPMGLGKHALVIAPNLFVRDRLLADFRPPDGRASAFFSDPVIPPELSSSWDVTVYDPTTCPRRLDPSRGALVVTNYHQLLRDPAQLPPAFGSKAQLGIDLLFSAESPTALEGVDTTLIERFEASRGLLVLNDEAHHVGDEPAHAEFERKQKEKRKVDADLAESMAWIRSLRKLHGTRATSRLALQVDLSATLFTETGMAKVAVAGKKSSKEKKAPRTTDLFKHTTVRYDLPAAIRDGIVKRPILERITLTNSATGVAEPTVREGAPNGWEKYRNLIVTGVRRWKAVRDQFVAEGDPRKPILFLLCQDRNEAAEIANFLRHGEASRQPLDRTPVGLPDPEGGAPLFIENDPITGTPTSTVVEVHIGQKEEKNEEEWERVRQIVNAIDHDEVRGADGVFRPNPYNVVISVMMLKEGWDVRNVKVIVPLRPCDSRTLTEQILGRGLRKMHQPELDEDGRAEMRPEELYVMEHPSFAHILDQIDDLIESKSSDEIGHTPEYIGILKKEDPDLLEKHDVRLVRFEGLTRVEQTWFQTFDAKKLAPLGKRLAWLADIPEIQIKTFLMKMLEQGMTPGQEFTLPEAFSFRDLEQVLDGAFVKPILDELKAGYLHKNAVKAVVRGYLERSTFQFPAGLPVKFESIEDPESGKLIIGNLARGEVVDAVKKALVPELLVAMRGGPRTIERAQLTERRTRDLPPYQAIRKQLMDPSDRTVFTRTATDSEPEKRVATVLDRAPDVEAWVYNHRQGVGFYLEYDHLGHPRRYFPDYVVRARLGTVVHNVILEVKGRFDDRDRKKARNGQRYADMLSRYDREPWHYVLLVENSAEKRMDLSRWHDQPIPTIEELLRYHERVPLLPEEASDELRFAKSVLPQDEFKTAVPVVDLEVTGGSLGAARVATSTQWAYLPSATMGGIVLDDRVFVAQLRGKSMEPGVPDGSWCVFRSYADDAQASVALDRRRVLVEVAGDTEHPDEGRYALKRVVVSGRDEEGGITEVELRSDNAKFKPIRVGATERLHIRAELLRIVSAS